MKFFKKIIDFVKESRQELSRVVWLPTKTVLNYTLFVIIAIGISTVLVALFDILLIKLVQILILK